MKKSNTSNVAVYFMAFIYAFAAFVMLFVLIKVLEPFIYKINLSFYDIRYDIRKGLLIADVIVATFVFFKTKRSIQVSKND